MVKDHARIIGIVMLLAALGLGAGLAGVATRGAWAQPAVDAPIRCALLRGGLALDACDEAMRSRRPVGIRAEAAYDDVDARYDLGVALVALDRPEDALREFRQVLRRAPMDADAHYNVGRTLNSLGRHAEAARAYREAVRARPDHAAAWGNLGLSAILIGQYGEAREAFERASTLVPEYFDSRPIQRQAWELASRLSRRPDSR